MYDEYFTFNERSTIEFGMAVEKRPTRKTPKRRRTAISIPGKNGDLHFDEDAYENVDMTYEVWFRGGLPTPEQAHAVKSWLLAPKGYSRLEDKYDPAHFYLASFAGPMDIADILGRYGRCKIKFDCDPRCFLKTGEFPFDFDNANEGTIYNPTAFTALPLIYLYGSGAGTVRINDVTVDVLELNGSLILDCETENCYYNGAPYYGMGDGPVENKNSNIYAPQFPVLKPGINTWKFTGDIDVLRVIPRWWEP